VRVGSEQVTESDTRVIAASHVDLGLAAVAGTFREDLYFRLGVLELLVPPLRERREDIPALARHIYHASAGIKPTAVRGFSAAAMAAMVEYPWPGNVRELHNRIQRAVVMADQRLIAPADLGLETFQAAGAEDLQAARSRAEYGAIRGTLQRVDRNVTMAALELGISRMTLYRLMTKHGISQDLP
ncbi:MAG: sigma-54-dependent Fis family transcriptional regulator, partial [Ramlibacter sp.]|nr:sigma-54-dependent Fis family transcriptional regulator [Ramlibacter sp.]